jgi:hypothetical protein
MTFKGVNKMVCRSAEGGMKDIGMGCRRQRVVSRFGAVALVIPGCYFGTTADASPVNAGPSTVVSQSMFSYATYGNGDVVFQLTQNPLSQCYGFWLRASDAGFKNNFAILLTVIQTQGMITVSADDSDTWTGSAAKYCLVTSVLL